MKVERKALIAVLDALAPGLSPKAVLEQSDCFVFHEGRVITFNDDIMATAKFDVGIDAVVGSDDLRKLLSKFPDAEVDIIQREGEVVVRGDRRSTGHLCSKEILLPIDAVPVPPKKDWAPLGEDVPEVLEQAADACGNDETQNLATVVSVTPGRIEACDNYRLLRWDGNHGFGRSALIPARSLKAVAGCGIQSVAMGDGWVYFKTGADVLYSVRCSHEPYHEGVDALLKIDGGERIRLPAELAGILDRALVMNEGGFGSNITVGLNDGELSIYARKPSGWFRERKSIKYKGRPLRFNINPRFFIEVLQKTRTVLVSESKLKIEVGPMKFVVCLMVVGDEE